MVSIVLTEDFQIFLRIINNTNIRTAAFFNGISRIFANIFCNKSNSDLWQRPDSLPPTVLDEENVKVVVPHPIIGQGWSLERKMQQNDNGNSQAVFNALETTLKNSMERLKIIRESFSGSDHAALVRALCIHGKVGEALQLRNAMLQKKLFLDVWTYNHLINRLCKMGQMEKASSLLIEMSEVDAAPNRVTYNTLIHGYCRLGNINKAHDVICSMEDNGIKPNKVTWNILLHAHCRKGLSENAKKILTEKLEVGSLSKKSKSSSEKKSDKITSVILLDTYCKEGDMVKALELWTKMSEEGTQIDVGAYNVLIHGFLLKNELGHAYAYLCDMLKRGFFLDLVTCNTLISRLCRLGKLDEACEVHTVMPRMGVKPDHASYQAVIHSLIMRLCRVGKLDEACEVHTVMSRMGVKLDQASYQAIIHSLCLYGNVIKAKNYLVSMLEDSIVPKPLIWNVLIHGYGKCKDLKSVLILGDQMRALGVKPNIFTYNALACALVKAGYIQEAQELRHEIRSDGLLPDVVTYNMLIGAACSTGDLHFALQLLNEMSIDCNPDIITYTELIRGFCRRGNMKHALELFRKIQTTSLPVDHVPFQVLIKAYCKMGDPEKAFGIYQEMIRQGFTSRPSTYHALFTELLRKGFKEAAQHVFNTHM